jgi:spore coat polysaccharide biosynthesis protein SpsF
VSAGRRVAIVQARMGSTRLPGKVLLDLGGQPMLARVLNRLSRATRLDAIVLATSDQPQDDPIAMAGEESGIAVFRGDEALVINRYHGAATAHRADTIVRVTADCPFIDPAVVDQVVGVFESADPRADFAANTLERSFPHGLDVEVASFAALDAAWREAKEPFERIHVFPYLYRHPERFRLIGVTTDGDHHGHRWTVDTSDDLAFARALYAKLGNDDRFTWQEALATVAASPELQLLNAHVRQKALEEG